jgi:N-acetylglucosamine malate deacetylase 1
LFLGNQKLSVLVIAPHPDDETLGVGGTMAKLVASGHDVTVATVSGHLPPLYPVGVYEETEEEARAAYKILGVSKQSFLKIPATFVGNEPVHVLNQRMLTIVRDARPDVVLLPYPDRHVDHRIIFESAMVATRPVADGVGIRLVAAYETLSETHWNAAHIEPNFVPNMIVDISDFIELKLQALACYRSQIPPFPGPRSLKAVESLATFRGTQAGFGFGEAFQIIRLTT